MLADLLTDRLCSLTAGVVRGTLLAFYHSIPTYCVPSSKMLTPALRKGNGITVMSVEWELGERHGCA